MSVGVLPAWPSYACLVTPEAKEDTGSLELELDSSWLSGGLWESNQHSSPQRPLCNPKLTYCPAHLYGSQRKTISTGLCSVSSAWCSNSSGTRERPGGYQGCWRFASHQQSMGILCCPYCSLPLQGDNILILSGNKQAYSLRENAIFPS